jgi:hypothetical protein
VTSCCHANSYNSSLGKLCLYSSLLLIAVFSPPPLDFPVHVQYHITSSRISLTHNRETFYHLQLCFHNVILSSPIPKLITLYIQFLPSHKDTHTLNLPITLSQLRTHLILFEHVITYMYSGSLVLCILLWLHENQLTNFLHIVSTNLWSCYDHLNIVARSLNKSIIYLMTLYQLLYRMRYSKMIINYGWIWRDVGAHFKVLYLSMVVKENLSQNGQDLNHSLKYVLHVSAIPTCFVQFKGLYKGLILFLPWWFSKHFPFRT